MTQRKASDRLQLRLDDLDASLVKAEAHATASPMAKKSIEPGSDRFWGYPPA